MRRVAAAVIILLALAIQAGAVTYTITDLGSHSLEPMAISDTGYIAGRWSEGPPTYMCHGFVWHDGIMTDVVFDGYSTEFRGVNDLGQVAGSYYRGYPDADYGYHGFVWQDGAFTSLGTLGGRESEAWDINNAGQVTGWALTLQDTRHGFLYDDGVMTNIDPYDPNNMTATSPMAINQGGDIVGKWHTEHFGQHAFLRHDGELSDLGVIDPVFSVARDVNDLGWVVGQSHVDIRYSSYTHAFLWRNDVMEDLGSLSDDSTAEGINNRGQVVGMCYNGYKAVERAFIWQDGIMSDLNSLIDPNSDWFLSGASAINNLGQIVGGGTLSGQYHGFLLTPVPEPSGLLALAGGIGCLAPILRRRR